MKIEWISDDMEERFMILNGTVHEHMKFDTEKKKCFNCYIEIILYSYYFTMHSYHRHLVGTVTIRAT